MKAWPSEVIERWPLEKLKPYARNARTHSPAQISQIAASIREFGFVNPVLARPDGTIIAGHGRVLGAAEAGLAEVPVMVAKGWTKTQCRAYVLADNQLALNAGWDAELLSAELLDLGEAFDLGIAGFSDDDIKRMTSPGNAGLTDPDDAPEPPADPVTVAGDVWICGAHRVMCGDSRAGAECRRLFDGAEINIAFTSPPYAEQRDYDASSGFRPIPPREYVDWFAPVAANIASALADDGSWFLNIKPPASGLDTDLYVFDLVIAHVREWGWHLATEFCWERAGVPKNVTQRFKNQFEPVYQFARGRWKMRPDAVRHESDNVPRGAKSVSGSFGAAKKRRNGQSGFISDSQGQNFGVGEYIGPGLAYPGNRLPTFSSSHQATGHAAAFPPGLPGFFIKAYTDEGDVVFDPFLGSGSTLIAAESETRKSLGMELSPAYVDVSVLRWEAFTGKTATLEATGQTFAQVRAERTAGVTDGHARPKAETDVPEAGHRQPRKAAPQHGRAKASAVPADATA